MPATRSATKSWIEYLGSHFKIGTRMYSVFFRKMRCFRFAHQDCSGDPSPPSCPGFKRTTVMVVCGSWVSLSASLSLPVENETQIYQNRKSNSLKYSEVVFFYSSRRFVPFPWQDRASWPTETVSFKREDWSHFFLPIGVRWKNQWHLQNKRDQFWGGN